VLHGSILLRISNQPDDLASVARTAQPRSADTAGDTEGMARDTPRCPDPGSPPVVAGPPSRPPAARPARRQSRRRRAARRRARRRLRPSSPAAAAPTRPPATGASEGPEIRRPPGATRWCERPWRVTPPTPVARQTPPLREPPAVGDRDRGRGPARSRPLLPPDRNAGFARPCGTTGRTDPGPRRGRPSPPRRRPPRRPPASSAP